MKRFQVKADCSLLSPQGKAGTLSLDSQQFLSPYLTKGQSCTPSMATSMAHCLVSTDVLVTQIKGMGGARNRSVARSVNSKELMEGCEEGH